MHSLRFWEGPLAEDFGTTRVSRARTACCGALIRFGFAVTIAIAFVFYFIQEQTIQQIVSAPISGQACTALGSPPASIFVNYSADPNGLAPTLESISFIGNLDTQFISQSVCVSWLTKLFNAQFPMSRAINSLSDIVYFDFSIQAGCGAWPPGYLEVDLSNQTANVIQQEINVISNGIPCVTSVCRDNGSPNITGYLTNILWKTLGQCGTSAYSDIRQFQLTAYSFASHQFNQTYWVSSFDCYHNGVFQQQMQSDEYYIGYCSNVRSQWHQTNIINYCNKFTLLTGPYLCTTTSKRAIADVLNLSFAAGSSVTIFVTIAVKLVHNWWNPKKARSKSLEDGHRHEDPNSSSTTDIQLQSRV